MERGLTDEVLPLGSISPLGLFAQSISIFYLVPLYHETTDILYENHAVYDTNIHTFNFLPTYIEVVTTIEYFSL